MASLKNSHMKTNFQQQHRNHKTMNKEKKKFTTASVTPTSQAAGDPAKNLHNKKYTLYPHLNFARFLTMKTKTKKKRNPTQP